MHTVVVTDQSDIGIVGQVEHIVLSVPVCRPVCMLTYCICHNGLLHDPKCLSECNTGSLCSAETVQTFTGRQVQQLAIYSCVDRSCIDNSCVEHAIQSLL